MDSQSSWERHGSQSSWERHEGVTRQQHQPETRHADGYAHLTDCEAINPKPETRNPKHTQKPLLSIKIMKRSHLCILLTLCLIGCRSDLPRDVAQAYKDLPDEVDFNFDVRPVLSDRCYACHGPDAAAREADLRLDTEEGAKELSLEDGGFAVVAGDVVQSAPRAADPASGSARSNAPSRIKPGVECAGEGDPDQMGRARR